LGGRRALPAGLSCDLSASLTALDVLNARSIGDILDRLGLRRRGVITQAAQVLYGTSFLPDYPQCLLKLGRFRGTAVTGEIVDNRQECLHAFAAVREGLAFLERTLPLGSRFPQGQIFREDRLPLPTEALREILLNAVIHRDYSSPAGHIAIAVFDDRVEIRSSGRLPAGVTVEQLSGPHLSELRNPLIAGAFHRAGAVEIWGRGTNRVIDECRRHGAAPPAFSEQQGFVVVTFTLPVGVSVRGQEPVEAQPESQPESSTSPVPDEYQSLEKRILGLLKDGPLSASTLSKRLGQSRVSGQLKVVLKQLLSDGRITFTVPDKPNSRLQKYRVVAAHAKRPAGRP
jgi:ATP-dependent DNA helicase RecG